ncbi:GntR family transcriptional regulator [Hyunsoonleella pacifica]|uniref:GntR family transcriptional regulator n=1 Tax=Hyunsoonleella pacifica TaxID=1080224 RepID=A0A4Q9FRR1_9FLAO|nr:winged helix-turn-helix domain-containing protein [Hyunsoonleella pacifica]TBN18778.1 GntR family transcriptional regulator [Hyunsoonleella pacifica]GGD04650.1 transcriptional regulator [Hyunsoonleella pacifica]
MIDHIKLDANSMVPKYLQIINSIVYNISNGNAKIGDKVPSINKLSQEFYLSRDTVERAYRVLRKRKIIVSVQGKGTYIANTELISKLNVLFFVNKLSPYKMMIYNSFLKEMGDTCHVDLHSYHCDETLFLELMTKYKNDYDYYVIVPHFRTENLSYTNFTSKVSEAINEIPKESLVLLDSNSHQIEGDFIEVFQDFENDIFTALEKGKEKIDKYNKLTLVYPKTSFYPYPREILNGFRKYCANYNFDFEIIEEISNECVLEKKTLYITIEDDDLVRVMHQIKESNFTLGRDIGVISYNDAPLKQILGITVISIDFNDMGIQTAKMITENKKEKVKAPFYFMDRGSV